MTSTAEASEATWTRVCAVSDIVPNTGVCCLVGRDQVAVFRVGDSSELYALSNWDPFSRANVLSRGIVGDKAGVPKVASPIFKQSFSLQTGECLDDPDVKLPTFQVRVTNEIVEVREQVTQTLRVGNSDLVGIVRTA
jgi:nitrite reductase (NADH) small subunit